jgi:hypothetical protein
MIDLIKLETHLQFRPYRLGRGDAPPLECSLHRHGRSGGLLRRYHQPKSRLSLGAKLSAGDAIVVLESSGIHANGALRPKVGRASA